MAAGMTAKDAALASGLAYEAAKRHVRLHERAPDAAIVPGSILDTFQRASGHPPMDWQREMLGETRDTVLIKGRQVGATEVASGLVVHTAMHKPGSTSVVVSPSLRQSTEVTRRARLGLWQLGVSLRQDSVSLLRLDNGARIVSLPGSARGIRGYAADLVIIDEAAFVSEDAFVAARPMTAATKGRTVIQSTPGAPVGRFHELVMRLPDGWAFMRVRSDEASNVDPAFLERERRDLPPDLFSQEYMAEFGTGGAGLFTTEMIDSMFEEVTA